MGVVACNQYEVSDRFEEHKVVRMPFKQMGEHCKPDLLHVLVPSTSQLSYTGKFVTKLVNVREVSNYGNSFIYQVQTLSWPQIFFR